jgi:hypothetical protein
MSSFEKYTCWKEQDVRDILDIEALHVTDAAFLATHSPVPMRRIDAGNDQRQEFGEDEFLEDILAPQEDYQFVPVLGSTGVGKSHLVRWLSVQLSRRLSENDSREVLLIPKAGTNLRDILLRILDLPEADDQEFERYRKKVEQASTSVSDEEGKKRLLDELALAAEEYDPFEGINPNDLGKEERKKLKKEEKFASLLPSMMRDIYFRRECWLKDEGPIERLYERHIGEASSEGEELEFTKEDLPLDFQTEVVQRKAPQAFDAFRRLKARGDKSSVVKAALRILNDCLDRAIRRFHNFDEQNLHRMMLKVRQALSRKGIDLILLIEDIAVVQGIDRQLVAAVLERESELVDDLCQVQTVFGCTEGYYHRLENTVQDRVEPYRVDLNIPNDELGKIDLTEFAARYLNAVRHGQESLKEDWGADEVSSWCARCDFKEQCHDAFGAEKGIGLYPFNETALRQMYERVAKSEFNPRRLIQGVLKKTLLEAEDEIDQGEFPSASFHAGYLEGTSSTVTPGDRRKLPDEDEGRWEALLDLWREDTTPRDFPDAFHEAFSLEKIDEDGSPSGSSSGGDSIPESSSSEPVTVAPEEESTPEPADPAQTMPSADPSSASASEPSGDLSSGSAPKSPQWKQDVQSLRDWASGQTIEQSVAQFIRDELWKAIDAYIDWNALTLRSSFFSKKKTNAPFRSRSIQVEDSIGGSDHRWVTLKVPLDHQDRNEIAFGLEGYRLHQEHGHWRFEDGPDYYQSFMNCLEEWADEVVGQLQTTTAAGDRWDPAPMAVEILAVGARLHGRDMSSDRPVGERLDALLAPFERPDESQPGYQDRSKPWSELAEMIHGHQDELIEILDAHTLCLKGNGRTKVYDVSRFAHVLSSLEEEGELHSSLPVDRKENMRDEYAPLWKCYRRIQRMLSGVVEKETAEYREWHDIVRGAFGDSPDIDEVVVTVNESLEAAQEVSPGSVKYDNLERIRKIGEALRDISESVGDGDVEGENGEDKPPEGNVSVEEAMRTVKAVVDLDEEDGPLGRRLSLLGKDLQRPMHLLKTYAGKAGALLEKAEARIEGDIEDQEGIAEGVEETLDAIEEHFEAIDLLLRGIDAPSDLSAEQVSTIESM